jgi:predicted aspartyl protease
MAARLEVPDRDVLAMMDVEVVTHDEPWVATVRAFAVDGLTAEFTWDQVAASVTAIVLRGDQALVRLERESMVSVRVLRSDAGVHFEAVFASGEVGGTLMVDVGATVVVRDALLRQ